MNRPENLLEYSEVDLKLGIKSSLPHVKSTLALAIIFWEATKYPSELIYSKQKDAGIVLTDELEDAIKNYFSDICTEDDLNPEKIIEVANGNQLFKSQMEALIVAFELVWKIAKVSFCDTGKPASAERTGGTRYPKKFMYTTNTDIIHSIIESDEKAYKRTLLSWIGIDVSSNIWCEKTLLNILTTFAESAVFKLNDGDQDVIFNQDSIYRKLLQTGEAVDVNGDKEAKGSLRILKSLLSDEMNPYLTYSNGGVSAAESKLERLKKYQQRVSTMLSLSATKLISKEETYIDDAVQDNKKSIEFRSRFESHFKRNRILFGAPGTGKSFTLNKERKVLLGEDNETDYERVTFHPDYSYANFVGTYKPVMVKNEGTWEADEDKKEVIAILKDKSKSAQEKYDLLYDRFKADGLTRLPVLLGLYCDDNFKTRKQDGTDAVGDNSVERNHGRAIRPYVNLDAESTGKKEIAYEYVPGPFMRVLVKALKSCMDGSNKPYLLVVEEINRANVAAVFGDVFQLLDRDGDNISEYPIATTNDMRTYLAEQLGVDESAVETIKIPDNMFIWATMNSADQGVFPMDTAFKRRWDFTYLGIDDAVEEFSEKIVNRKYVLGKKSFARLVTWNDLRTAINETLSSDTFNINEDKLLGPYFIAKTVLESDNDDDFIDVFKNKVLMYLFDDAVKQKRKTFFEECSRIRYSEICKQFDDKGVFIFPAEISKQFTETVAEQETEDDIE